MWPTHKDGESDSDRHKYGMTLRIGVLDRSASVKDSFMVTRLV